MDTGRASVRNVRSKCRCSYVLQFTFRHAVCCVLHRPPSQVIHCEALSFSTIASLSQEADLVTHHSKKITCLKGFPFTGGEQQIKPRDSKEANDTLSKMSKLCTSILRAAGVTMRDLDSPASPRDVVPPLRADRLTLGS